MVVFNPFFFVGQNQESEETNEILGDTAPKVYALC